MAEFNNAARPKVHTIAQLRKVALSCPQDNQVFGTFFGERPRACACGTLCACGGGDVGSALVHEIDGCY